jgi:uroporphyrin-III C-methyltransferase
MLNRIRNLGFRVMDDKILKKGLYLIGGGPGDPELITLKAHRILKNADIILFDNLINKELLDIAADSCQKIYVGKQPYSEYMPQESIHELIAASCTSDRIVVRLKGGDPYIFGRGYEEVLFAAELGIESFYVPGISSMQTSGLYGIPLTHRGVSESIWIITGTKKDGSLSGDLACAINSKATVVIYMGMKKLAQIASVYEDSGLGDMPAAIIQNASRPNEKKVICTAGSLEATANLAGLTYPAILVIGAVVGIGNQTNL